MKICELMSRAKIHYSPGDKLKSVIKTMTREQHSCGIICEHGKPVGIVTERDFVRFMDRTDDLNTLDQLTVGEVMTPNPICVTGNTEIAAALDLARSHNLRHLPVVRECGEFCGVITLTDLIKALSTMHSRNIGLRDENSKLRVLAIEDPLTGLPNRRAMEVDLSHAAAVAAREDRTYALALIDIDYFKKYNDNYGHPAGDLVLKQVASILNESRRDADKLYRYGGEEFLLLMPFTQEEGSLIATNRMLENVKSRAIPHAYSPLEIVTVSVGLALSSDRLSWKEVLENADSALYHAKETGRNQLHAGFDQGFAMKHCAAQASILEFPGSPSS
jgi:diguanylate cyclase (GGDEF)-like protein